jgi:dolichol-phosphate mannosyltransferase
MNPPAQPRILVSLATYNERDNLAPLLREIRVHAPTSAILVTDDNSPDGTGPVADKLAAADPTIHVIHRSGKLGLGTAILGAARYAIEHDFDWFVNMDADFSHHPRYLPALFAGMADHDVMIGSRYVPGGGSVNWPLSRRLMSQGVNLLVRLLMGLPARDTSGGFRCYSVALLRRTNLNGLVSHGYSFQQEMLYRCRRAGCRIGEIPILFEDRRAGQSKAGLYEAVRSLSVILWIGFRALLRLDGVAKTAPAAGLSNTP